LIQHVAGLGRIVEQGRLVDPGFAENDQRPGRPPPGALEQAVDERALAVSADEH
jgi:hypothetical protein